MEAKLKEIKELHDFVKHNKNHIFLSGKTAEVQQRLAFLATYDILDDTLIKTPNPSSFDYPTNWEKNKEAFHLAWERARDSSRLMVKELKGASKTTEGTPLTPKNQPDNCEAKVPEESADPTNSEDDKRGLAQQASGTARISSRPLGQSSETTRMSSQEAGSSAAETGFNSGNDAVARAISELTQFLRQHIVSPSGENGQQTTSGENLTKNDKPAWKLIDAGLFWPDADPEKSNDQPLFHDSKGQVYYVDANLWVERISEWADTPDKKEAVSARAHTLLRGEAFSWWELQLADSDKTAIRDNYNRLLERVKARFGIKHDDAGEWLNKNPYTLADNQKDKPIRKWAMDVFRYSKEWGDRTPLQQLARVWQGLHPRLQGMLSRPVEGTSKTDFLDSLYEKQQALFRELSSRQTSAHFGIEEDQLHDNNAEDAYWEQHNNDLGTRNYNSRSNRYSQQGNRYNGRYVRQPFQSRNFEAPTIWDSNSRLRQDRRSRYGYQDNRDVQRDNYRSNHYRGRGPFRSRQWGRYRRYGQRRENRDGTYNYVHVDEIWAHDRDAQDKSKDLEDQGFVCYSEGEAELDPADDENDQDTRWPTASQQNYFVSDHRWQNPGHTYRHQPQRDVKIPEGQVIDADLDDSSPNPDQQAFTYLKIDIRANLNSEPATVCLDTGSSGNLVDEAWITQWANNPVFTEVDPTWITGVNGRTQVTRNVKFDFYIQGDVKGSTVNGHFSVSARVIPDLGPRLLLGIGFCKSNKVKVDVEKQKVTFGSVRDMVTPAWITKKAVNRPVARKVTAQRTTIIPAMTTATVSVHHIALPAQDDGLFYFNGTRDGTIDGIVDKKGTQMVFVHNDKAWPIKVKRDEKLGRIEQNPLGNAAQLAKWEDVVAFNCRGVEEDEWTAYLAGQDHQQVYATTPQESEVTRDAYTPGYGIAKPTDIPFRKSKAGVSICDTDPDFARRIATLIDKFDIFRNRGIVPMAEEDKLRVDLVDGWQGQMKAIRPYPLGVRDLDFLNEKFDGMHREGKMSFLTEPTPIACPVFIVWKNDIIIVKKVKETKQKGRPVVDLRPLNKVVVPDVYPLPDQDDIMNDMAGKSVFSSFDATGFFFQLPVKHEHRNRMVVISPRGLERSNVALMGFRNSPAFAQRFMDRLFREHRSFVRVYIDDIVIFSDNHADHEEHLRIVMDILDKARIHISAAKSFAAYPAIRLLGHVVDGKGIAKTDDRIEAFKKLAFPRTLEALETYLGMAGWLRRGIAWFDVKSQPLQLRKTELLKQLRESQSLTPGMSKQARQRRTAQVTFEPTQEELDAFAAMQEHLCTQYVTYHHQRDRPLFLKVDACKEAYGLMVFQLSHGWDGKSIPGRDIPTSDVLPILFMSRLTSNREKMYGSTEGEVSALLWSCKKLRKLVQSSSFPVNILTDHSATSGIVKHTSLNTVDLNKANPRLANAANYLSQFSLNVFHIPGYLNVVPDALSRLPVNLTPNDADTSELDDIWDESTLWAFHYLGEAEPIQQTIVPAISDKFREQIVNGYDEDAKYGAIWKLIREAEQTKGQRPRNRRGDESQLPIGPFEVLDGLLYHVATDGKRSLCVPKGCVQDILHVAHDKHHHFGKNRMMHDLEGIHFFQKVKHIRTYLEWCPVCRENQTSRQKPLGELSPSRSITTPFHTITLDFVTDMPKVPASRTFWALPGFDELDCLLTISCRATKRTGLLAGHTTYGSKEWAEVLLRFLMMCDWGLPTVIISDRDPKFTAQLWKDIFDQLGVKHLFSTAYHAQTDGLSERKNQTVEIAIRFHTATDYLIPWTDLLPSLQHHLNNTLAVTVGRSPNEALFGVKPRSILDMMNGITAGPTSDETRQILQKQYIEEAARLVDVAGVMAKQRYDERHTQTKFEEGDTVYLRLGEGYHLPGKPSRKWSPVRAGPYKIIGKVNDLAVRLNFPVSSRVHPVVSVTHLYKPQQGEDPFNRTATPPGPVTSDVNGDEYELEKIVQRRIRWYRKAPHVQYLVRWKGYSAKDDTWIKAPELRLTAPDLVEGYEADNPVDWEAEASKRRRNP